MTRVTFRRAWRQYQAGETAGFDDTVAAGLIKDGIASPAGKAVGKVVAESVDLTVSLDPDMKAKMEAFEARVEEVRAEFDQREADLNVRAAALDEREAGLDARTADLDTREAEIATGEAGEDETSTAAKVEEKAAAEKGAPPKQGAKK
ncbi:hypothetical protein [Pseudooceanicola sp.]|uniref:hypothetical protein n=1 Tax=Pseudooceanicola sp. TaxID=1914328 RepID=UPI004058D210